MLAKCLLIFNSNASVAFYTVFPGNTTLDGDRWQYENGVPWSIHTDYLWSYWEVLMDVVDSNV
jgi:hypothetical protein